MPLFLRFLVSVWILAATGCADIRVVPADAGASDSAGGDGGDALALPLSVTIESPVGGAVVNLGASVHFSARVSGGAVAFETLTATWTGAEKKVLATAPVDAGGHTAFDKADLPAGPQTVHVEVSDGNGSHAGRDVALLVNTAPAAATLTIAPEKPTTLDPLRPVLQKPLSDVDRAPDKLHVTYTWHKEGATKTYSTAEDGVLAAGIHKRGEVWVVSAEVSDGSAQSPAATAKVAIGDAAPVAPLVHIAPAKVDLKSEVSCETLKPASDPDGDPVTLQWGWRVGDYVNPGATSQKINVEQLFADAKLTSLSVGAQLSCTVLAADDQLSAPLATSPTVTVQAFDVCASKLNPCGKNAKCTNSATTLSATCACESGFTGDGKSCIDINECTSGVCSLAADCTNTVGGFQCTCKSGWSGNGQTCSDVNECAAKPTPCDPNASCSNLGGSYACACKEGWSGDGKTCQDIDECGLPKSVCDPNATCQNTPGGYKCPCNLGYIADGSVCSDVNECLTATTGCSPNSTCINTGGGFTCPCKPGFAASGSDCNDVDECALGTANCSADADCSNTAGGFLCACKPGWSGTGVDCADIDECALGTAMCGANAKCTNLIGSFDCSCKAGYSGDGKVCTDINECTTLGAPCAQNADCTNTLGDYTCTCQAGHFGDGKVYCSNKDLCVGGGCSAHAKCSTVLGTATGCNVIPGSQDGDLQALCTCDAGWAGCGLVSNGCQEIDECALPTPPCSPLATCTNTIGSFVCGACAAGYSGDGFVCTDINECAATLSPCDANATCKNSAGSYTCTCLPGFVGDGSAGGSGCANVDECSSAPCSPNATCLDSPGSYTCTCMPGFDGNGKVCIDVNECANGTAGCAADASCDNTPGAFVCTCNAGYSGDGKVCSDIDECKTGTAGCSGNATCANSAGGFTCTCDAGYSGNGKVCTDIDECPPLDWSWNFASQGASGWTLDPMTTYKASNPQSPATPPNVAWQVADGALYYGNPATGNYNTAVGSDTWANKGNATSPVIALSSHPSHQLSFDLLMNTETSLGSDKLQIQLVLGSGATEQAVIIWDKSNLTAAMGVQKHYIVYLPGYGGKSARLRFVFDTVDGTNNQTLGVQISNLAVRGAGTPCHAFATCSNSPGSYTCACNAPWAGNGTTTCEVLGSQGQPASSCKAILDLNGTMADDYYWLKWSGSAALMWCDGNGWTRVIQNDFEVVSGAWIPNTLPGVAKLSFCGSKGLMGGLDIAGAGYSVSNSPGSLPTHTQMRVQGTLQCIDKWQNQSLLLSVDGVGVWSDVVTNPPAPGGGVDSCGNSAWADLKRNPNVTFSHTANSALLQFTSTLTEGAAIAAWGIDDISVWVK